MRALWLMVLAFGACDSQNLTPPGEAAATYAKDLGLELKGKPSCAGVDTDNDGYVTCTLNVVTPQGAMLQSVQCAATESSDGCVHYATGCKQTQMYLVPNAAQPVLNSPAPPQ